MPYPAELIDGQQQRHVRVGPKLVLGWPSTAPRDQLAQVCLDPLVGPSLVPADVFAPPERLSWPLKWPYDPRAQTWMGKISGSGSARAQVDALEDGTPTAPNEDAV